MKRKRRAKARESDGAGGFCLYWGFMRVMFIVRYVVSVLIVLSLFGCISIQDIDVPSTVNVGDKVEIKATLITVDEWDVSSDDYVKPYIVLGMPGDWKPISVKVTYGPIKPELLMTTYVPEDLARRTPEGYRWYMYKPKEYYRAADYLNKTFKVIANAEVGNNTGICYFTFMLGLTLLGDEHIKGSGAHPFKIEVVGNN
jgi:hypothetical protein